MSRLSARSRRQRGAATLVVVMVLFFLLSMVAAYTSRNLIFEQRTATNQYRATQALEAADAGAEWAVAMLNSGRITDSCVATDNDAEPTFKSFRQRYLSIDSDTGSISFVPAAGSGSVQPRCVFDGSDGSASNWKWSCTCPQASTTNSFVSSPSDSSFVLLFTRVAPIAARPDLFQVFSNSCTRLDNDCLNFNTDRGGSGDGVAATRAVIALRGALTKPPVAALTVMGTLATLPSGTTLALINDNAAANGITLHTNGLAPPAGLSLSSLPGNSGINSTVEGDDSLSPTPQPGFTGPERRFAAFFGMRPDVYRRQPGMVTVDCSLGCSASAHLLTAMSRNPGRAIWVTGSGTLTLDANVGSASAPALLIIDGDVSFSAGSNFTGLLYGRKLLWEWSAAGTSPLIRGAVIAEGDLQLTGAATVSIAYDAVVLKTLRVAYGTFVRVPGGWQDFQ